jgi:hypothetical protein
VNDTTAARLVFRRVFGTYVATAPLSGEADAFRVRIARNGRGWHAHATTHGHHLAGEWFRTLNAARDWARLTFATVNV